MEILFTAYFMTRLKEEIIVRGKQTYIDWRKFQQILLINAFAQGVPFARDYGGLLDNRFIWRCIGVQNLLCERSNWATAFIGMHIQL